MRKCVENVPQHTSRFDHVLMNCASCRTDVFLLIKRRFFYHVVTCQNTYYQLSKYVCSSNMAFRHVETLFAQGNQVRTDQNKPPFFDKKEVCFWNALYKNMRIGLSGQYTLIGCGSVSSVRSCFCLLKCLLKCKCCEVDSFIK